MKRVSLLAWSLVASSALAQPIIGVRNLALSPDGSRVAFSYLGDIWVAPSAGGRAIPLTSHIEMDDQPVWSPDGKTVAFGSNRYGNFDIFVVGADGGRPQRVTQSSSNELPSDFSPDGQTILFRCFREDNQASLYGVQVGSGKLTKYYTDNRDLRTPQFSPDGTKILFQRNGFPNVRPRYQGSAAAEIDVFDLASKTRKVVRNNGFQHLWARWTQDGNGILAIAPTEVTPSARKMNVAPVKNTDNAARTPNVLHISLSGAAKARTAFVGGAGVRYLSVSRDGKVMAFERDGVPYVGPANGSSSAQPVNIMVSADDKTTQEERLVLNSGVTGMDLSPDNETVVFEVRNELWRVPVKKGKGPNADDATQLTNWEGLDVNPILSPDGKTLYYLSDKSGASNLWAMDMATKQAKAITDWPQDITGLKLMPLRKSLCFIGTGEHAGLHKMNLETKKIERVIPGQPTSVFAEDTDYSWSPDERYVAYSDQINRSGYYFWENAANIMVWDTRSKQLPVNVSRLAANEVAPAWSPDGKYLYFQSDRGQGVSLYALPLSPEDARTTEIELKYEKPKDAVKCEFDFDQAYRRARRIVAGETSSLVPDPENGELLFLRGGDLWKAGYDGDGARALTQGGGFIGMGLTADAKQLQALKGGTMVLINHRAPGLPQVPVSFRADWTRDLRVERSAAYQQFWRSYNRGFYDPGFHGRDWAEIGRRYKPLLSSVGHRNEMATILGMMTGELESSHSEVSPAFAQTTRSASTAALGVLYDYGHAGPGMKIAKVLPRSPGSYTKTKLRDGEVILRVNGKDASLTEDFFGSVLNDQVGRDVTLTVAGLDGKSRDVKFRALSSGEQGNLIEEATLENNRALVEKASRGKVGYVHIAAMGQGDFVRFNQEFWEAIQNKRGMIIDCRGNAGGNISDRLIDMLERRPHSYYQNRGGEAFLAPGQAFEVPLVVMCDDASYSNGEMFPYAMRQRGLAKLVGKRTPGYVIWTTGLPLVDGTNGRMPGSGVYRMDGTPIENNGQQVDYSVELPPEAFFAGQDPQLDKAVQVLLGGKM